METMTREECIARIMEFEDNAGYGQEDMPNKSTKKSLEKMSNKDLIDLLEDLTTNYGIYKIEE